MTLLAVPIPLWEKVVRSIGVHLFLVVALPLGGRRELAQLSNLDLVVSLLLSNTVQNAIIGDDNSPLLSNTIQNAIIGDDNSLLGGLLGATVLLVSNCVVVQLDFRYPAAARTLEGTPTVLVDNGATLDHNLRRSLISTEELAAAIRKRGPAASPKWCRWSWKANGALTVEKQDHLGHLNERLVHIEARLACAPGAGRAGSV